MLQDQNILYKGPESFARLARHSLNKSRRRGYSYSGYDLGIYYDDDDELQLLGKVVIIER